MVKTMLITSAEMSLIQTVRSVRYGEMFGVEVPDQIPSAKKDLSPNELSLVNFIRSGIRYIDVLTVHQGEPAYAEVDCNENGFHCRRKIKFPTEPLEG